MLNAKSGPLIIYNRLQIPAATGVQYTQDYNADGGPSAIAEGSGLLDPRFGFRNGVAATEAAAYLFSDMNSLLLVNQAPSVIAGNNIAVAANAASGTAMTLVASTAAGITKMASALTIQQTGNTIPSGSLAIDGLPAVLSFGQNGAVAAMDPRTTIARAVSVTGVTSGTGGHFIVSGADLYGFPQTEDITAAAGAGTTAGKKAFKFIYSVTPQFADAHNYSVGTTDVYGFPLRVDEFQFANLVWNAAQITASTGFLAAVTTSPATTTTGDVRGTYAVQSAADGTKKLTILLAIPPWNMPSVLGNNLGFFGVTPA